MNFRMWINENEEAERTQAFERYSTALNDLHVRYGTAVSQQYLDHERRTFMAMPIEDLRREMEGLPKLLQRTEADLERRRREMEAEERRESGALRVGSDRYYQADNKYERIVCSRGDPGFASEGMQAYDMGQVDASLKGWYGVHVGPSSWLPILKRDGYCDDGDAYIFTIHADEMLEDGLEVYEMEDPHVMDRTETPDSQIIFTRLPRIPAKYVELTEVVPEDEIEEAPDPHGMDDDPWGGDDDDDY